jgi:hypothetical protein
VTSHKITIEPCIPPGSKNKHYIALCSCRRWRSSPYRDREQAETKGLAHSVRGDAHVQALAAADHGSPRPETVLQYYREMSEDPFTDDKDRDMWRQLAEELADRLKGDGTEQDVLFD